MSSSDETAAAHSGSDHAFNLHEAISQEARRVRSGHDREAQPPIDGKETESDAGIGKIVEEGKDTSASGVAGATAGGKMNRQALKNRFPALKLARSFHVLPDQNTIYVSNPKAACSTIKLMLSKLYVGDYSIDPRNVHEARILPSLREVGWRRLANMLDGEAFRFTFVRHPVKRAISGYGDKLVRQRGRFAGPFQQALGRPVDPDDPVSFEDFISVLELQDPAAMDPHWRPQWINTAIDRIDYDLVGRVETFDADWAKVRRETGLPDVPIVHRNRSPSFVNISDRPDLLKRLEAIYARDFETFGY